ncbi:hypothetical protein BKA67DRAFT_530186 [Truncatella angustata]|uniref:Uncharacterized protein n=1 Tax=Truncatella angustata TaxID=152316 RepID=A0A9P8UVM1_9PEZI|nr:uncharacterized protein BKA67DRAFT_530186 [Truncatella angustata]KAH6660069.1 hypothetical protein BKA67DRAFT_530186 [Truncatella angustata]
MRVGLLKSTSSAGRPKEGQSNIRGKVISGPIPIPDPVEDDEFPMRQPSTGLATPLGNEGANKVVPQERSSTLETRSTTSGTLEVPQEERVASSLRAGTRQASDTSGSPTQKRTNSTLRYSTISSATDQSHILPRRKKSTLRSTLGRLFGRKKAAPRSLATHQEDPASSAQHRSDPSNLGRVLTRESEPKRSASLPITEFDRALRSHSIGLDDILAIESARNSLNGEPMRSRRRAATTSSKLYIRKSRELNELIGLSPRPASTHGRTVQDGLDGDDPENIGRAITSDVLMQHRRSRSLSQLRNVAEGSKPRSRNDEIRYWRESYGPGLQSPSASSAAVENDDVIDGTGHPTLDLPELPQAEEPKTPPQPFDFGLLFGTKITQAASLEERVATLEVRNEKLERLVTQLFELVPGVNKYEGIPRQRGVSRPSAPSMAYTSSPMAPSAYPTASLGESPSRYSSSRHSNDSFGEGVTFIGSIPPAPGPLNRPMSTATVRGAASLPTLSRETLSDDRYSTLLTLLESERAARQYLEAQLTRLSKKFDILSQTPQKAHPFVQQTHRITYSVFEHDDDDDEANEAGRDDQSVSEAFETPREERPKHGFGAFGEELTDEDEDGSRKRAARTLSLSQLTMRTPRKSPTTESGVEL